VNYQRIYENLVDRAREREALEYSEKHHVVPRCLGGSDCPSNLVSLTPEEHYVAHQLLVKIHPGSFALAKAAAMMIPGRPSNKMYGWLRRRFSTAQSDSQTGCGNSQYGTKWVTNGAEEKKILKSETPEYGWKEGRKSLKIQRKEENLSRKAAERERKTKELRALHEIYIREGFDGVRKAGYEKSKPNLVMQFAKYLPEFVPQNGKKRGNQNGSKGR
jgi:hypothetical protein